MRIGAALDAKVDRRRRRAPASRGERQQDEERNQAHVHLD
jgi:hypothetical protein